MVVSFLEANHNHDLLRSSPAGWSAKWCKRWIRTGRDTHARSADAAGSSGESIAELPDDFRCGQRVHAFAAIGIDPSTEGLKSNS